MWKIHYHANFPHPEKSNIQIFALICILCLRTCRNKCFTSFVSFVFCEVLNKSLCQIFCFCFPLRSICVSITRIKDCRIYARKLCRYFKLKYGIVFVGAFLMSPFKIASMIPRVSLMEIRFPVPFHPVFTR